MDRTSGPGCVWVSITDPSPHHPTHSMPISAACKMTSGSAPKHAEIPAACTSVRPCESHTTYRHRTCHTDLSHTATFSRRNRSPTLEQHADG